MAEKNKDKYAIRTDLATEILKDSKISNKFKEQCNYEGIEVSKIEINEEYSQKIGRKPGVYYTIDTRAIETHDNDDLVKCENVLAVVLKEILKHENVDITKKGLVVGLGNINVTPDSLGPLVVDNVIVTRHMFLLNPNKVSEGISEISAVSPGVMGTTGIETFDIIDAIINKIDIDYMIVVDALASRAIDRVNKTIQVTNTGISPGSGVGNKRKELSKETMGIPVIAVGVPTVVDAVTITSDTIDIIMKYMHKLNENKDKSNKIENIENIEEVPRPDKEYREELFGNVGALSEENKRKLIDEILTPSGFNMMVTPKEVDLDIAAGQANYPNAVSIDKAVHPLVGKDES